MRHTWTIYRYEWYGVPVRISNLRICTETGLKLCDLIGQFPDRFYPATTGVPFSLLKK